MPIANEEVRLKVQTRNNRLYKLILADGWVFMGKPNVAAFCRKIGVGVSAVGDLLNLRKNPFCENGRYGGEFTPTAIKIAEYFKVKVEELFPVSLYDAVNNSKTSKAITLAQLPYIKEMITAQIGHTENLQKSGSLIPSIRKIL